MRIYQPFISYNFRVNEDSAVSAQDQILQQVNSEENYEWGKYAPYQSTMTYKERLEYLKSKGRKYYQAVKFLW